jgi:hypothetical protein
VDPDDPDGPTQVEMTLMNEYGSELQVLWVDYEGNEVKMGGLAVGETKKQLSYPGHVWRMRDNGALVTERTVLPDGGGIFQNKKAKRKRNWRIRTCKPRAPKEGKGKTTPAEWVTDDAEEAAWLAEHGAPDSPMLSKCGPGDWLSKQHSSGFHVICVIPDQTDTMMAGQMMRSPRVVIFKDGLKKDRAFAAFKLPQKVFSADTKGLLRFLSYKLGMSPRVYHYNGQTAEMQPPGIFTFTGLRIAEGDKIRRALSSERDMGTQSVRVVDDSSTTSEAAHTAAAQKGLFFLFEGGQWVWPAVEIGHTIRLGQLRHEGEDDFFPLAFGGL